MEKTVYLDNNATSAIAPEVKDVMLPFLGTLYGNPSSMHAFGGQVAKFVDRAREEVAAFLNCSPEEVIFTSCATESDNSAIRGTADWFGKDLKVITTAVEHPAVLQPVRRLKALGFETVELPVNGAIKRAREATQQLMLKQMQESGSLASPWPDSGGVWCAAIRGRG